LAAAFWFLAGFWLDGHDSRLRTWAITFLLARCALVATLRLHGAETAGPGIESFFWIGMFLVTVIAIGQWSVLQLLRSMNLYRTRA
jgi:hypothetical protein